MTPTDSPAMRDWEPQRHIDKACDLAQVVEPRERGDRPPGGQAAIAINLARLHVDIAHVKLAKLVNR